RKVATAIFVLILSGLGTMAATEAPKPADQARTMSDVIDRVITNENRANQQIKQYSPLVETYIQNLRPDKDLGYAPAGDKYFLGRIWVEDQDYNIVRFNGAYGGSGHSSWYFHFDSWRANVQPGQWMPSFVYSEERDLHYALAKKLDFKAQTRLWGYNVGHASQ